MGNGRLENHSFLSIFAAQFRRCATIRFLKHIIEAANALIACTKGHIGHGQACLINQLFGKMQTTRLHNGDGRHPKMFAKQAA